AYLAAGIYLLFAIIDWGLLWWLPKTRRSFGPVGPQLYLLTLPRFGAAVLGAGLAYVLGTDVGLLSMFLFQLLGTAVYGWGLWVEPFALGVTGLEVHTRAWPAGASPIRLLHLSDFHVERLTGREHEVLAQIRRLQPDIIVITGDYLNLSYVNEPTARAEVQKVLRELSAPYGVYATLGSPPVDQRETTPSLFDGMDNIRLLRDEVAVLEFADGRKLSLLGLDCEHHLDLDAEVFHELEAAAPADSARILLYHSPELMPGVQEYPVDLYLCGHTHGGQIRLPIYGAILTSSQLGKRYEMGKYVEQDTTLYISRGIGLEGLSAPRMRLLCKPEIILFTISGS
ncbi:MAG: hypothetical protein R3264_23405, partial [Anaerolineae bacterium]|nr:hypothetical protein [Anaerolineae bacterium]